MGKKVKVDLSNGSASIIGEDGQPTGETYGSGITTRHAAKAIKPGGWKLKDEEWKPSSPPDGFERGVEK